MQYDKVAEVARALTEPPRQQYAIRLRKELIEGKGRGEGGGGSYTPKERAVEDAFEQMRRENAGLSREQRRERMRVESEKEFNRGANMSDAEWDDLVNQSGLRSRR